MSNTDNATTVPYVVEDCRGRLQLYSDGSIVRSSQPVADIPLHDDASVLWNDVLFDPVHNLHLRLYKPSSSSTNSKLPIYYFIHGGGFCLGSCTWPNFHNYCLRLSSELQALIISPDYRLAPENRLPAAIEDGFSTVKWLQTQAVSDNPDSWLTAQGVDFRRVFISGDSAGGNIAHHLAVRLSAGSLAMEPVQIRGYILTNPFFGGAVRTRSEAEGPAESFLNLENIDMYWRLSLPVGETADHPLVNPFGPASPSLESVALDPILVVVGDKDLLRDRIEDYVRRLKEWGKDIQFVEFEGEQHSFITLNQQPAVANKSMQIIKDFIAKCNSV
ncbi:probable carboxylesterase 15 [Macadamia integrifolia]|uniref:probable carboxylesterase 15 n=1 Tax=Macadamia integrifolia TaxID=60698 RepID=UPI001C52DC07|nr:probable carboxylesterase 15 [Macadamia integrifolia]